MKSTSANCPCVATYCETRGSPRTQDFVIAVDCVKSGRPSVLVQSPRLSDERSEVVSARNAQQHESPLGEYRLISAYKRTKNAHSDTIAPPC